MSRRRVIGSILSLAILAGALSSAAPFARADCAPPKAKAEACPSCAPAPGAGTAAISADRSCCVTTTSLTEREPARIAPVRSHRPGETRILAAAVVVPAARVLIAVSPRPSLAVERTGASPPPLRTTLLLI